MIQTSEKMFPNEGNTLLIFGNGLDIDMGFPTSYKEFFNSEQFPFVHNDHTCHSLGHYVYEKGEKEKWYDLENILAEYGMLVGNMDEEAVRGDKEDFDKLVHGLVDYLNSIDFRTPNVDSAAARILRACCSTARSRLQAGRIRPS